MDDLDVKFCLDCQLFVVKPTGKNVSRGSHIDYRTKICCSTQLHSMCTNDGSKLATNYSMNTSTISVYGFSPAPPSPKSGQKHRRRHRTPPRASNVSSSALWPAVPDHAADANIVSLLAPSFAPAWCIAWVLLLLVTLCASKAVPCREDIVKGVTANNAGSVTVTVTVTAAAHALLLLMRFCCWGDACVCRTHSQAISDVYSGVPKQPGAATKELLGEGGTANVYKITHRETRVEYALKLLDLTQFDTVKRRELVLRELDILKTLQHPGIVKVSGTQVPARCLVLPLARRCDS